MSIDIILPNSWFSFCICVCLRSSHVYYLWWESIKAVWFGVSRWIRTMLTWKLKYMLCFAFFFDPSLQSAACYYYYFSFFVHVYFWQRNMFQQIDCSHMYVLKMRKFSNLSNKFTQLYYRLVNYSRSFTYLFIGSVQIE